MHSWPNAGSAADACQPPFVPRSGLQARLIAVVGAGIVPPEQERGFCEVLVPWYCRAVHDLKLSELVAHEQPNHTRRNAAMRLMLLDVVPS